MKKLVMLMASMAMFESALAAPEDNPINDGKNRKHHAKVKLAEEKGLLTSGLSLKHVSENPKFPAKNNRKLKANKQELSTQGASVPAEQPSASESRFPTKSKHNYKLGGKR